MKRKVTAVLPEGMSRCKCGTCVECCRENTEKAFIFRDAIVSAFAWEKTTRLEALVRQLLNFVPSTVALTQTGIGRLLFDADIWKNMDPASLSMLALVKSKWKASVDHTCESKVGPTPARCSLVQMKAMTYLDAVQALQAWCGT